MDVTKKRLVVETKPAAPLKKAAAVEAGALTGADANKPLADDVRRESLRGEDGTFVNAADDVAIEKSSALTSSAPAKGAKGAMALLIEQKSAVSRAVGQALVRTPEQRVAALLERQTPPDAEWLLAAHLAKFMDNVQQGGWSVRDVAKAYMAAHPHVAHRFPDLQDRVQMMQRRFAFMPGWTHSPALSAGQAKPAAAWEAVIGADVAQMRLDKMLTLLSEVPLTMALTEKLADRLSERQPFQKHNVVMVQHMLGQANPLVDALRRCGMDPKNAEYVGVPYQQNPAVQATLENTHGVTVTVPEQGNIENMYEVICAAVDRAYERHLQNGEPILILDDGGYASKYIASKYRDQADLFTVVEQTTRGLTEIAALGDVPFAIANVGGSYGKRFESAQVGDAVKMSIRGILDQLTTTPTRKDVLIVGAGKVGEGVADSFAGDGARVTIFDPYITPFRKRQLEKRGYTIVTDKAQALDKKFLVIGCSGHRSINMEDFYKMSSPVFVASASSKKVEVDAKGLEGETLIKVRATKINEQETNFHYLKDGRVVVAMAELLPVNFQRVNSIAPELIDHTMALMLLGAAEAVEQRGKKKGLFDISASLQFWLQADMEGIQEGPSDDPQAITVKTGPFSFSAKPKDWMRIATSAATPPEVLHELVKHFLDADDPMNPVLLAICGARHELDDETVDLLLDYRVIPHMTRLLQNELLTDAQEQKIVDWLVDAYRVFADHDQPDDATRMQVVAVRGNDDDGWVFDWPAIVDDGFGRRHLHISSAQTADSIIEQLGEALFSHPQMPEPWRLTLLHATSRVASAPRASTVLSLQNPAWKPEELDELGPRLFSTLNSLVLNRKQQGLSYAYDIAETLSEHPSASPALQDQAAQMMKWVREVAREARVRVRGSEGWETDPATGVKMPFYGDRVF